MTDSNDIGYERVLVPVGDKSDPNMLTHLSSILVDPRRGAVRFTHVTTDRSFVAHRKTGGLGPTASPRANTRSARKVSTVRGLSEPLRQPWRASSKRLRSTTRTPS
nr:hypothetical protein [Halorubrum saccharovorum]